MKKRNAIFLAFVAMFALSASAQLPGLPEIDQEAPLDEPVTISKEILAAAFGHINDEDIPTTRMLDGGDYNVNIRHFENVTMSPMRM